MSQGPTPQIVTFPGLVPGTGFSSIIRVPFSGIVSAFGLIVETAMSAGGNSTILSVGGVNQPSLPLEDTDLAGTIVAREANISFAAGDLVGLANVGLGTGGLAVAFLALQFQTLNEAASNVRVT